MAAGSPHGKIALQELPSNGATTVGWESLDTITASLSLQFPNSLPAANQLMLFPAPTSGISQWTWTTFSSTNLTDAGNLARNLTITNEGATGTTLNRLASLTGAPSTAIVTPTTAINGAIGITISGAGTSGSATIAVLGSVNCVFDGATTAGDYVQISSTAAGDCHDSGSAYPANGQVVGRVLSTNASAGTYGTDLFSPGIRAGTHISVANAASTGTLLNALTKLTGAPSTAVVAATTDTGGVVGITIGGAGTSGNASIVTTGSVSCIFDGATTAGDYVQISASAAGDCHDAGSSYPVSGQVVGRVLGTNGSAGTYGIDLFSAEVQASSLGSAHNLAAPLVCPDLSGSGTAQSCTTSPSFTPAPGDSVIYKTTTANTGDLTINVNSLGAKHARKWQGSSTLASGDLVSGIYMLATYDGTSWEFYSIGNAPSGGGGGLTAPSGNGPMKYTGSSNTAQATADDLAGVFKCAAASGSGTAYSCATSPAVTPAVQDMILFKADVANTGAVTLNVNSSSAAAVKKQGGGTALVANDLIAGQWTVLIYDGTFWQMQGQTGNAASGGSGAPATVTLVAKTASYTSVSADFSGASTPTTQVNYALSSGGVTHTTPSTAPALVSSSMPCEIVSVSKASYPYVLQILTGGATTLDGAAYASAPGYMLGAGQSVHICSDGTNYQIHDGRTPPPTPLNMVPWGNGYSNTTTTGVSVASTANYGFIQSFTLQANTVLSAIDAVETTASGTCGGTCAFGVGIYSFPASGTTLTLLCQTVTATSGNGTTTLNINATAPNRLHLPFTGTGSSGPNNASGSCMLAPGTYGLVSSQDNTVLKIATYTNPGVTMQALVGNGAVSYYHGSSTAAVSSGTGTAGTFTLSPTLAGNTAWTTVASLGSGLFIVAFE
jgi:hypothetical protein